MRKVLVLGIIVLFLGVLIAPTIYANNLTKDNLTEVKINLPGLRKKHTVQLTQQESGEINVLFESIKNRLDNSKSIKETNQIYNDAIVELDRYGLLGDFSIKQVQKLVTGGYQKQRYNNHINRLFELEHYGARAKEFIKGLVSIMLDLECYLDLSPSLMYSSIVLMQVTSNQTLYPPQFLEKHQKWRPHSKQN